MSLQDDLDKLTQAHGPSALAAAFSRLQSTVRQARKRAAQTLGPLAQTMIAALNIWDAEKADGVPKAEREAHLEQTLRAAWPKGRTWVYDCDDCDDTGLILLQCTAKHRCNGISTRTDYPGQAPGKYKRLCTLQDSYEHDYVIPCHCSRGVKWRPVQKNQDDELAAVGKVTKPTRFGR